jgi:hypothetical protein
VQTPIIIGSGHLPLLGEVSLNPCIEKSLQTIGISMEGHGGLAEGTGPHPSAASAHRPLPSEQTRATHHSVPQKVLR